MPPNEEQQIKFPLDPVSIAILKQALGVNASASTNGRSHGNIIQSVPSNTATQITMANDFASGITWDSVNSQFVVITAGQYVVGGRATWGSPSAPHQFLTMIYVNGNQTSFAYGTNSITSDEISEPITDILTLNVGDAVAMWVKQQTGVSQGLAASGSIVWITKI